MWYKFAQNSETDLYDDPEAIDEAFSEPISSREKKLKSKKRDPIKFYHASKKLFKPGDILTVGNPKNFGSSNSEFIYMTSTPYPHYTVVDKAIIEDWNIYEVKPTGKVFVQSVWDDYLTEKPVIIIKRIGGARGISGGGKGNSYKYRAEEVAGWRDKIQEAKEAIENSGKYIEFVNRYNQEPIDVIKQFKKLINYGGAGAKMGKAWTRTYIQQPLKEYPNPETKIWDRGMWSRQIPKRY